MTHFAQLRELLATPTPENHLKIMELVEKSGETLVLEYAKEHLKGWEVEWEEHSLEDLKKFSGSLVRKLDCWDNQLVSLPENLNNLKELYCWDNQLVSLPENLNNLERLSCSNNQLVSLPENLNNLKVLSCSNNQLVSLPENLNNLKVLDCSNNQLVSLPENLNNLKELYCWNNNFPVGYLEEIEEKYPNLKIYS